MFDIYILFFVINFVVYLIDYFRYNLKNSILKKIILINFILLPGLRYQTGWDYEAYDYFFKNLEETNLIDFFVKFISFNYEYEPIFTIISYFSVKFFISPYLLVSSIITLIFYKLTIKYYYKFFYVIFLGYVYFGYFHQFSIIRQGLSISLLYFIFFFYKNNKNKILLCLISIFIHYSSIISLIYFYLSKKQTFKNKHIYIIIFLTLPFVFIKTNIIVDLINLVTFQKYSGYTEIDFLNYKVGFSLKYLETLLLIIFSMKFLEKFRFIDKIFFNMLIFELINYAIFNDITIIYERFNVIFEFSHLIVFVLLLSNTLKNNLLIYLFLFIFILIRYYQFFNSDPRNFEELTHFERFFPYKSIINQSQ
jgi:hypothetical protein